MNHPEVVTIARWLAAKAIRAEWRAKGRRPEYADHRELEEAIRAYFTLHRDELIREAWEHPVSVQYRERERLKLARKAVR